MGIITIEDLRKHDGKEGKPQYIAYKGRVYDVTESALWKEGKHMNVHQAGRDLTEFLALAPHGEEVFERYPVVGELESDRKANIPHPSKLEGLILRLHPHPISVHFPIALMLSQALFAIIYLFTGKESFETTSYYVMSLGLFATPVTIITGFLSWWYNYAGTFTRIFTGKIIFSGVLFVLTTICFVWRTINPQVLIELQGLGWLYLILIMALAPTVVILGYLGGKITFG